MCCSRAFRFLALLTSSAFRGFDHAGHSVRFVASMMLRTVLRTDCSRFRLFLCVCVFKCSNNHCHFHGSCRCTCTRFIETSAEVSSRTGSEEQGQMYIYIWIFCSICCKHDATNGASGRLLTFLAVSLCVFKCSNIYCHFHGSSGAHALASLKPQQKCPVEQGQMYIWI